MFRNRQTEIHVLINIDIDNGSTRTNIKRPVTTLTAS